jgi:hypothetical protein
MTQMIHHVRRCAARLAAGAVLVLGVAGCGPHPRGASSAPPRPGAAASPPPASTAHNWRYRDGQAYAYQGEGPPGGAVQYYRYLGVREGVYTLQVDGDTASCADPCQVITVRTGGFHVERLAFDPDSLIGAAFTDAFNGRLQVYDPARR